MSTLLLQIFLLLFGAFLLGAMVACLFRRLFSREHFRDARVETAAPPPRTAFADPFAATAAARPVAQTPVGPADTARFERALAGDKVDIARPAPVRQGPVIEVQPPAPRLPSAPVEPARPVVQAAPPVVQAPPVVSAPAPAPAVVRASPPPQPAAAPVVQQAVASPAPAPQASPVSAAAASAAAVAAASAAAALTRPAPPFIPPPSSPVGSFTAAPAPDKPAAPVQAAPVKPVAAASPAALATASAPTAYDDLTLIRGIDLALQSRLNLTGVRRYSEIAAWKPGDVARMSQTLGFAGRIEKENWIEQAQILSKGELTEFARRKKSDAAVVLEPAPVRPATRAVAAEPQTAPQAAQAPAQSTAASGAGASAPFGVVPRTAPEAASAAVAATAAAAAAAAASAAANRAAKPAEPLPGADRLHRILGVNAEAERLLIANGVTRFSEIANWAPGDVERFDRLLGRPGRIAQENWVEQAKILARTADADMAASRPVHLADAIRENATKPGAEAGREVRPNLSNLRSVRSEALRGDSVGGPAARAIGGLDDLKRVRGVGVLLEKKLNSLGVTTYEQVANWTGADIDRISQVLDFKGRIERENWVEQARILAAGGQTEFSRRVDKGEVESSRPGKT